MRVDVRGAAAADQPTIIALVRQARLNPRHLHWARFVVAEHRGEVIGVAQVRRYPDGARELASLVVQPGQRGHGVAAAMIDRLLADETGEVYALIDRRYVAHFRRWAFAPVVPSELPRSVRRVFRVGRVITGLASVLRREQIRIVPLRRASRQVTNRPG
ncbi:MAG TPA: GNAT family N-acetyltransferase [Micromonosporaceae bacterium]